MTNFRPLIAGVSLAAIALTFVGVGAYRKYHKTHPAAPVPITYVAPAAPVVVTPPVPVAKPKAAVRAHAPAKAKEKVTERRKVKRRAPSEAEADVLAKLHADANGGAKLSCQDVLDAVKNYPGWLLKKFEGAATEEQKARGAKCLQASRHGGGDVQ